jgi:hypothetical protein
LKIQKPNTPSSARSAVVKALFGLRSPRRLVGPIAGLALVVVALNAIDYTLHPWVYSWSGQTLTGYWYGEIEFEPGDRRQIVLHLTRDLWDLDGTRSRESRSTIEGAAKICGPRGRTRYRIAGATHNRSGTPLRLGFGGGDLPAGKHLNATEGAWDGEDRLDLSASLYTVAATGVAHGVASADAQTTASDRTPKIRFELKRSSKHAFDSTCS